MPLTEKNLYDNSPDSYFNGFVLFHPKQIIKLIVSESNPVLVGATPYLLHAILNWTSPPVALVHVTKGACCPSLLKLMELIQTRKILCIFQNTQGHCTFKNVF